MHIGEIVLPETKPEIEWVRGRALQKVSPTYPHTRAQGLFVILLDAWAQDRGDVGPEWRFRVAPPGEPLRPLVPDVAFVRRERLTALSDDELPSPPIAPDVAVEILSPHDEPRDVRDKIATYLGAGTALVITADPERRTMALHDANGVTELAAGDVLEHPALPNFSLDVSAFFARALDGRR